MALLPFRQKQEHRGTQSSYGARLQLVHSGRVAERDSGARTGRKSSARRAALCPRRSPSPPAGPRALLLATSGWVAIRCSTPTFVLARAGKVAQIGSAAVTIAEALVRSSSELPADRRCSGELRRSGRPEPGGQRARKPKVGAVSYPGDVAVWADQHGGGGADHAEYGELPLPSVARVDQLDSVSP
jgi:hypothetical protein